MHFTQNPIGSDDQLDLQDNAISFDYAMNSPAALWQDRFGKQHKTVQQALKDVGFKPAGFDFVSGGTLGIGDRDKCVFYPTDGYWYSWNGQLPYVIPANSSPTPGGKKGWGVITRDERVIAREALRRTYLEAGLNLVEGSFEQGGVLNNQNDVLLHEASGKAYSGPAGTIPAGTSPASGGFVVKNCAVLSIEQATDFGLPENRVKIDIVIKRERVNLLRAIPFHDWDAIKSGTSTLDHSAGLQAAIDYCGGNHAELDLPHGRINATNILLPANGIRISGVNTNATKIHNTLTGTPIFRTETGRNLWLEFLGFTCISKDLATSAAINIVDFEHLEFHDIAISTLPAQRSSAPSILLRRSGPSGFGYYLCTEGLKADKHQYGIRLLGLPSANLNANGLRGAVTNDCTEAGIRADFCSGLRIADGSAELNKNNIEIFDSIGAVISGYYMERPVAHNVQLTRANLSKVINNPVLSSAGAGVGGSGANANSSGRAVYVNQSSQVDVKGNGFIAPWAFYDVEFTADSLAGSVTDNRKKNRIDPLSSWVVEVLDHSGSAEIVNFEKTTSGTIIIRDKSAAPRLTNNYVISDSGGIKFGNITGSGIYFGTTIPEGNVSARYGSVYYRQIDNSGIPVIYEKRTGNGNTGWVAVT